MSVAVPVPGLGLLSYRAPGATPLHKGARVRVPLGGRSVVGCIVDAAASPPPGQTLKDVEAIIDPESFVPPDVIDLALWIGEYYACGPGAVVALAMPPAARSGEREIGAESKAAGHLSKGTRSRGRARDGHEPAWRRADDGRRGAVSSSRAGRARRSASRPPT